MEKTYEDYMRTPRQCKDYRRCLLCHGCRNYTENRVKCIRCSAFPKLICEHSEEEIVRGFELMHKNKKPKVEIEEG